MTCLHRLTALIIVNVAITEVDGDVSGEEEDIEK
jgi:hypothetical protein